MITLLSLILVTSIWVLGLTIATQQDMVLYFLREAAEKRESKIFEPIILCHWCMPSLHSIVGYLFVFGTGIASNFTWKIALMYPLVVCGSSLTCGLIWAVYKKIEVQTEHFKNIEQLSHWDKLDRKKQYSQRTNSNS